MWGYRIWGVTAGPGAGEPGLSSEDHDYMWHMQRSGAAAVLSLFIWSHNATTGWSSLLVSCVGVHGCLEQEEIIDVWDSCCSSHSPLMCTVQFSVPDIVKKKKKEKKVICSCCCRRRTAVNSISNTVRLWLWSIPTIPVWERLALAGFLKPLSSFASLKTLYKVL